MKGIWDIIVGYFSSGSSGFSIYLFLLALLIALAVFVVVRAKVAKRQADRLNCDFDQETSVILAQGRKELILQPSVCALVVFVFVMLVGGI